MKAFRFNAVGPKNIVAGQQQVNIRHRLRVHIRDHVATINEILCRHQHLGGIVKLLSDGTANQHAMLWRHQKFLIGPLSNGSTVLLANMAKRAGIPWDLIMSSDVTKAYKRHPNAYLNACSGLGLETNQVMMCAAHNDDLEAAQSHGMQTAYINRPYEYGPDQTVDFDATGDWDIITDHIGGIADALGC